MGKKAVSRYFYCISIALTAALSGVTVLAGRIDASADTLQYVPFLALALPMLLLANAVSALYWLIRLRFWWIVPALAFVFNQDYLNAVVQYKQHSKPALKSNSLTLATYNVGSFNNEGMGYSCKFIAQYMRDQQVDVICMQEFGTNQFFNTDSVVNALADWPFYYIPSDSMPLLQLALFSKYPITNQQLVAYENSRNCSLLCDLDVNGKTIRVFNNHLQTTEVTRNKGKLEKELAKKDVSSYQAEMAVYRLIDGMHRNFIQRGHQAETIHQMTDTTSYPMLVCGDFNSIPSSYVYKTIKGNKLQDGFQTCGHGYMYTFHFLKRLLRIDYIFHSPELSGVAYYSDHLDYSDHNPVVMSVTW